MIPAYESNGAGFDRAVVEFVEEAIQEGYFLVSVDPSLRRKENLERIGKTYDEYMKEHEVKVKQSRNYRKAYALLLRLVDARRAGAHMEEIRDSSIFTPKEANSISTTSRTGINPFERSLES